MNKKATQQFIVKYARLATKNALESRVSLDNALGQLATLGQLALVGIRDRAYYAYVMQIGQELRAGLYQEAYNLAAGSWVFPKQDSPQQIENNA